MHTFPACLQTDRNPCSCTQMRTVPIHTYTHAFPRMSVPAHANTHTYIHTTCSHAHMCMHTHPFPTPQCTCIHRCTHRHAHTPPSHTRIPVHTWREEDELGFIIMRMYKHTCACKFVIKQFSQPAPGETHGPPVTLAHGA